MKYKFDCKNYEPHTYEIWYEDEREQVDQCVVCGDRVKFNKDRKGRIDNEEYLKAHIREFCQPHGRTAKIYYQIYHPELYEQNRHLWSLFICGCKEPCSHGREKKGAYIGDLRKKGTNANR